MAKTSTNESLKVIDTSLSEAILERYNQTLATLTIIATSSEQVERQAPEKELSEKALERIEKST